MLRFAVLIVLIGASAFLVWDNRTSLLGIFGRDRDSFDSREPTDANWNGNESARHRNGAIPLAPKVIHRGDPSIHAVALTFDDGPHPEYTPRILAILQRYRVHATFFVVGKMAKRYPKLVQQEYSLGNTIGNHSMHHVDLTTISTEAVTAEWADSNAVIRSLTGETPRFCRPPSGFYTQETITSAESLGLSMVLWSRYPHDYGDPGTEVIVKRVVSGVRNGDIILLHDGVEQTIEALPVIITALQQQRFEFVTLDKMSAGDTM